MLAFALAQVLAALAADYWQLMAARILLAWAAGLYVPNASALAGAVVAPHRRGTRAGDRDRRQRDRGRARRADRRADRARDRMAHDVRHRRHAGRAGDVGTAARPRPRGVGAGLGRERCASASPSFATARAGGVAGDRAWATGAYTVYTYLAAFLAHVAGIDGAQVGMVLFVWGVSAAVGGLFAGALTDRFGARAVIVAGLALLAIAFALVGERGICSRTAAARPRCSPRSSSGALRLGVLSRPAGAVAVASPASSSARSRSRSMHR